MNFKKPKDEVVNDIYYRVESALRYTLESQSAYRYPGYGRSPRDHDEAMVRAITVAITEAMRTLVDNVYTDAEFEEDLGLTKK
jgi:hypothetical protein